MQLKAQLVSHVEFSHTVFKPMVQLPMQRKDGTSVVASLYSACSVGFAGGHCQSSGNGGTLTVWRCAAAYDSRLPHGSISAHTHTHMQHGEADRLHADLRLAPKRNLRGLTYHTLHVLQRLHRLAYTPAHVDGGVAESMSTT